MKIVLLLCKEELEEVDNYRYISTSPVSSPYKGEE
jgi:hypothetical protein